MKGLRKKTVVSITLILTVTIFIACNLNAGDPTDSGDDPGETYDPFEGVDSVGEVATVTAGLVSFNMVHVPGRITFPTKTDDSGSETVTNAYFIEETEVTYGLWSAVYMWAVSNFYTFANEGREGKDGTIGGAVVGTEPVTTINWRDAMVWMNALTEYYNDQNGTNLTCVYYTDAGFTTPIRTATDTAYTPDPTAGSEDNPYVKSDATGFRLMASNEWELAARYISDDGDNTLESGEYYPANYASGADALYNVTTGGSDFDGDGDTDYTSDVAVYGGSATPTVAVKSKKPNKLGLYNMNGNVKEWSFTLNSGSRNHCGGGFSNIAGAVVVYISTTHSSPDYEVETIGFRFSKSVQ